MHTCMCVDVCVQAHCWTPILIIVSMLNNYLKNLCNSRKLSSVSQGNIEHVLSQNLTFILTNGQWRNQNERFSNQLHKVIPSSNLYLDGIKKTTTQSFAIEYGAVEAMGSTHVKGLTHEMYVSISLHENYPMYCKSLMSWSIWWGNLADNHYILNHHIMPERYGRNVNFIPSAAMHMLNKTFNQGRSYIWALKP